MIVDHYIKKVCTQILYGELNLVVKGKKYYFQGQNEGPSVHLTVHKLSMLWDLYFRGSVGLGDAYIKGKFEADDLSKFLEFGAMNEKAFGGEMGGSKLYRYLSKSYMNKTQNSLGQSKKNIHAHYDLGNDFYEEWLDDSLTYSSGFFKTGNETLSQAQKNKFDSLIKGNEPKSGDHVLEIGSGWGSFAFYLISKFPDITIDTLTISQEQYDFVKSKIEENHLQENLNVIFKDYREHQGEYSRIYSIEMFEAVGMQYWQIYFDKIKDLLKPSGVFSMQTIVIFEGLFEKYSQKIDFIQKYIFPGGMLPTVKTLENIAIEKKLDFFVKNQMADSYHQTLEMWRQNFNHKWDKIKNLGYSNEFKRMWNFYLSYCSGGFKAKTIDVFQIDFTKNSN
ncbi:cyclopropane-fatty-acyl-phospholipid synthase family protein [Alphaproteobacteria bacterium]|nr:cyclopropane-fatty-acyl-phospholipid synthase family protein [Alphaproteobacteria bacterium]